MKRKPNERQTFQVEIDREISIHLSTLATCLHKNPKMKVFIVWPHKRKKPSLMVSKEIRLGSILLRRTSPNDGSNWSSGKVETTQYVRLLIFNLKLLKYQVS
jgi:hypothetical protein